MRIRVLMDKCEVPNKIWDYLQLKINALFKNLINTKMELKPMNNKTRCWRLKYKNSWAKIQFLEAICNQLNRICDYLLLKSPNSMQSSMNIVVGLILTTNKPSHLNWKFKSFYLKITVSQRKWELDNKT